MAFHFVDLKSWKGFFWSFCENRFFPLNLTREQVGQIERTNLQGEQKKKGQKAFFFFLKLMTYTKSHKQLVFLPSSYIKIIFVNLIYLSKLLTENYSKMKYFGDVKDAYVSLSKKLNKESCTMKIISSYFRTKTFSCKFL